MFSEIALYSLDVYSMLKLKMTGSRIQMMMYYAPTAIIHTCPHKTVYLNVCMYGTYNGYLDFSCLYHVVLVFVLGRSFTNTLNLFNAVKSFSLK